MTLLSTLLIAASLASVEVQTLSGETVSGQLIAVAADKITIEVADSSEISFPLAQLQTIRFDGNQENAERPGAWVELIDGSQLVATAFRVTGKTAEIPLVGGGQSEVPVSAVRTVRYKEQNEEQQGEWKKIRNARVRSDLIVIRKNDRIDYLEGVSRKVTDESVEFELDGDVIPVPITKVEGLIYYQPADNALPPATFRATDRFGSRLEGSDWRIEDSVMRFTTPAGFKMERSLADLQQIDFSADKIIFLSDIEPQSVEWTPYFATTELSSSLRKFYEPKSDRALMRSESSADDGKLQLLHGADDAPTIVSYDKGVAIHSRASLVYDLPADVRRFRALAGIDARVRRHGHVRFVIRGDGGELYAAEIDGSEPPREISVDVGGVRRLELFVDYGANQDIGDHLNLCNARLIK